MRLEPVLQRFLLLTIGMSIWLSTAAGASSTKHHGTLFNLKRIDRALLQFHGLHGRFPSTAEGLTALTVEQDGRRALLHGHALNDAWAQPLVYVYPARSGDLAFDLYSAGRDGLFADGQGDDISNWQGFNAGHYSGESFWPSVLLWVLLLDLPVLLCLALPIRLLRNRRQGARKATNTT